MRRYRVLLPLLVHTEDGSYGQGEEFGKEFSEEDERANIESGLLEIVPQEYRVIGTSVVHDTQPGETFMASLLMGPARLLIESGNVELVESVPAKPKRQAKADKG